MTGVRLFELFLYNVIILKVLLIAVNVKYPRRSVTEQPLVLNAINSMYRKNLIIMYLAKEFHLYCSSEEVIIPVKRHSLLVLFEIENLCTSYLFCASPSLVAEGTLIYDPGQYKLQIRDSRQLKTLGRRFCQITLLMYLKQLFCSKTRTFSLHMKLI